MYCITGRYYSVIDLVGVANSQSITPNYILGQFSNGALDMCKLLLNLTAYSDVIIFQDAAKVCQEFMKLDPKELRFTVMALSKVD